MVSDDNLVLLDYFYNLDNAEWAWDENLYEF